MEKTSLAENLGSSKKLTIKSEETVSSDDEKGQIKNELQTKDEEVKPDSYQFEL